MYVDKTHKYVVLSRITISFILYLSKFCYESYVYDVVLFAYRFTYKWKN